MVSRTAVFSAGILPSAAMEPEQSATKKKCSGRRESMEPGRMIVSPVLSPATGRILGVDGCERDRASER